MRRAILLLLACGCAAQPAPRDTIQAGVIARADLDGVWYFRQTVVGTPYTTGFTFIGEQGENELEKIRWDIQEDLLVARRTWEWVRGTEKEPQDDGRYLGAPVAAWKIKSHFDIVRDYNASTGEELNKIVENTERKWYERKFMRVDWSVNLITNFDFLVDFESVTFGNIKQDPAPYWVSNPEDPDHMRIERPGSEEKANYLEVTQKIVASPPTVDFVDWANVPLCWLEYASTDCASQEVKIRNSFLRAGPRDYEPLAYDDHAMEKFGYFTTDRQSYNRQYGQTETGRIRLINRFNLWRHSMTDTACKKDEDCGPVEPGRRCVRELPDATDSGRCALPYKVRNLADPTDPDSEDLGPRPIVYHVSEKHPPELIPAAERAVQQYDETFRGMVKTLTGRDNGPIFVLCPHNPVVDGDPAPCGPAGTRARIGDLRYSMLYWVDEPQGAQLLGYGPSGHDPETGETIQGLAFVYGASVDTYATQARDIVRLVNGEIMPGQFIDGEDVKQWVEQNRAGPRRKVLDEKGVAAMADAMDLRWAAALPSSPSLRKASGRKIAEMVRARSAALARTQLLGADRGLAASRLSRLKGTPVERRLTNGEILMARGIDPRTPPAQIDPSRVGTLSAINPETARLIRRERRRLGARGVDLAEPFDDAVIGFAIAQEGKDPLEVWRTIRAEVFRSTAEHEIGHTLGLRHNFAGSYDPMNYSKTYWELRGKDGTMKPRYLDPETDAERTGVTTTMGLRAGISEFQTSSVMDYGAKFNSDIQGLGRWDRAAIKYGYGGVVEVFNQVKDPYLVGALQATVTFGYPQPLLVDCKGENWMSLHYTKLPSLVNLDDRSDVHLSQVKRGVVAMGCQYPDEVEHAEGRLAVPYKFCSDEFEAAATECFAYDRGADIYEVADNAIRTYRNYYLLNNFKRDRLGFNPEGYLDRIFERYLDPLRTQMQFYVLIRSDFAAELPDDGKPTGFWRSPDAWGPYTVAVTSGFDLLGEVLTTPEPGDYYRTRLPDGREVWRADPYNAADPSFQVKIPDGRYFTTEWDYDSGYYWYERVRHIGVFLDKVAALAVITDPETHFLGADAAADVRQYAINYWRLFPRQITEVWAAALTERWDRLGPQLVSRRPVARAISQPLATLPQGQYGIDPQIGFSVQLYAATLGLALLPATFDQTFFDQTRLFLQGNGQEIDAGKPKVTFTDPTSGRIWVALSFKDGNGSETGIAARMLERATALAALVKPNDPASEAPLRSYVEMMDVVRSLSSTYADEVR